MNIKNINICIPKKMFSLGIIFTDIACFCVENFILYIKIYKDNILLPAVTF